jgi:hypothetical protein
MCKGDEQSGEAEDKGQPGDGTACGRRPGENGRDRHDRLWNGVLAGFNGYRNGHMAGMGNRQVEIRVERFSLGRMGDPDGVERNRIRLLPGFNDRLLCREYSREGHIGILLQDTIGDLLGE